MRRRCCKAEGQQGCEGEKDGGFEKHGDDMKVDGVGGEIGGGDEGILRYRGRWEVNSLRPAEG